MHIEPGLEFIGDKFSSSAKFPIDFVANASCLSFVSLSMFSINITHQHEELSLTFVHCFFDSFASSGLPALSAVGSPCLSINARVTTRNATAAPATACSNMGRKLSEKCEDFLCTGRCSFGRENCASRTLFAILSHRLHIQLKQPHMGCQHARRR